MKKHHVTDIYNDSVVGIDVVVLTLVNISPLYMSAIYNNFR
jgi:hypothetical protein